MKTVSLGKALKQCKPSHVADPIIQRLLQGQGARRIEEDLKDNGSRLQREG